MKSIIRIFGLMVAIMLSSSVMVSCGSDDDDEEMEVMTAEQMLVGKWTLESVNKNYPADMNDYFECPSWMQFNPNNTCTFNLFGETVSGGWVYATGNYNSLTIGKLTDDEDDETAHYYARSYEVKELTKNKLSVQFVTSDGEKDIYVKAVYKK